MKHDTGHCDMTQTHKMLWMSQHNFKEHNENGCLWKRKSMCATSKNTIKMNVFEKENQNKCDQRNVPLRLKTEK